MDPTDVADLSRLRLPARSFPGQPFRCAPTVVFLDFDGPLHPMNAIQFFIHLDRFEALLRDAPDVQVVFSTSWQLLTSFEHLKTVFLPDLRHRAEGGTAQLAPAGFAARERLAKQWMEAFGKGRRWVSIDDDLEAFSPRSGRLLWCPEGYREQEDDELRRWLTGS